MEKQQKVTYVMYCRKSSESEDRQVLSLDSQEDEGKELALKQGLTVDTEHILRESRSAKIADNRPLFSQMLGKIENGDFNGVVTWHPDRLSRNALDAARLITLMDDGKLLEIVTPMQIFRNTPSDKFFFNFLCSQAKMENDKKGIDVKRGLEKKAQLGKFPIQAPMGYMNVGNKGDRSIVPDPERFDRIKELFDMLLSGSYTPMQILQRAISEGLTNRRTGKLLTRSNLYYLFHNHFYYGEYEFPRGSGKWRVGDYPVMITKDQYYHIQAILGKRSHPFSRRPKEIFPYRGQLRCGECGASITAEEKIKRTKGGNVHRYIYYHCTKRVNPNCSQSSIRAEQLDEQFLTLLKEIEIPKELHQWAIKELKKMNATEAKSQAAALGAARRGYDTAVVQLNKLIDLRLNNEITEEELRDRKSPIEIKKNHFKALIDDTDKRIDDWIDTAERCFDFAEKARSVFEKGGSETRTHILTSLGSNFLLKDKILSIQWAIPLSCIRGMSKEARIISDRLEPQKDLVTVGQIEENYAASSTMLRG